MTELTQLRRTLTFDAASSRQLAHRASVSEVLPTDTADAGDGYYLVAAQAPRSHLLFNDGADRFIDLLVLVETVRQGGTVVAHRFLDVPLDLAFVLRSATLEVLDLDAMRSGSAPAELVADLTLTDLVRREGVVTRMSAEASLRINGRVAARGGGAMIGVPMSDYEKIRPRSLKSVSRTEQGNGPEQDRVEVLAPALVGRTNPRNVVVGKVTAAGAEAASRFSLVVDTSHPHFFDHPQDHVPGTLLLEALRQSAVAVAAPTLGVSPQDLVVTSCTTAFKRYVELGRPATCHVTAGRPFLPVLGGPSLPLEVEIRQSDLPAAMASLHVSVAP
jgi:hypothetical protein